MANNNGGSHRISESELPDAQQLPSLLAAARPFLRGDLCQVDPDLSSLVSVLCSAGAGECYHKHGTFLAHLLNVYRILRLWGAPDAVARCGLYHSAYSNSYVNLAIFEPDVSRDHVRAIIGAEAERLVHLFCVVPRHTMMHEDLHHRYTDGELGAHLAASEASVEAARRSGASDASEPWRKKLRSLLPPEGIVVGHIRTGEPVALPRRVMAVFILMTIADFSDQYTDYQDKLFGNEDGRLEFRSDNWGALWPGSGKPGLWMSAMSRLAALYRLVARDEEIMYMEADNKLAGRDDEDLELVIPPVFDGCTRVLDPGEQMAARDLYWEAACSDDGGKGMMNWKGVEELLRRSIEKNPFVGEPHLALAQVLLNTGRYGEAAAAAEEGVRLLLEWGEQLGQEDVVGGVGVVGQGDEDKAEEKEWPRSAWGIINLGLVRDPPTIHECMARSAIPLPWIHRLHLHLHLLLANQYSRLCWPQLCYC